MTTRPPEDEQDACGGDWTNSSGGAEDRLLARTIEGELIPRLMMSFSVLPSPLAPDEERDASGLFTDTEELIEELIRLLLTHDARVAAEYLNALRARGATLRDLYLDLLAPAARRLGARWEADSLNFAEVTIGVSRLHQILLQFSPLFCAQAAENTQNGHTAAFFALPGETHTFGILMVVEFFRRAGWTVYSGTLGNDADVSELLSTHNIDILGISISGERHLDELGTRIDRLRGASRNREIQVMCGGHLFVDKPELAQKIGADGYAADGERAVELAETLVSKT